MIDASKVETRMRGWPLGRVVVLILAGGFFGLMGDLRMEHVDAVRDRGIAWTPIVYCGVMGVACLIGVFMWRRVLRRVLMGLFAGAFVVGGLGFYLHNGGNLLRPVEEDLQAWTNPEMTHPEGPPRNAPLSFGGLGLLGIAACLECFGGAKKEAA